MKRDKEFMNPYTLDIREDFLYDQNSSLIKLTHLTSNGQYKDLSLTCSLIQDADMNNSVQKQHKELKLTFIISFANILILNTIFYYHEPLL